MSLTHHARQSMNQHVILFSLVNLFYCSLLFYFCFPLFPVKKYLAFQHWCFHPSTSIPPMANQRYTHPGYYTFTTPHYSTITNPNISPQSPSQYTNPSYSNYYNLQHQPPNLNPNPKPPYSTSSHTQNYGHPNHISTFICYKK